MMPAPSDAELAELWASATMLAEQRATELPSWVDLTQLDSDDAIWAGVQGVAIRELEPPPPRPWRATARAKQLPPAGRWRHWILSCGRGFGKAVDVNTPIPCYAAGVLTADTRIPAPGWKRLGDIRVGDLVMDESGRPCRVTAIYEPRVTTAYRLTFSDGATVDACADHQWVTWTHADRKAYLRDKAADSTRFPQEWPTWRSAKGNGPRIRTTQQIVNTLTQGARGDLNHCVPAAGPLQLPERDLPIDPWVLGYWLGNGTATGAQVTANSDDTDEVADAVRAAGFGATVRLVPDRGHSVIGIPGGLRRALMDNKIMANKHVPDAYLWSSADQREALLRGLMDSDGHCAAQSGHVEFCSVTEGLADAVVHLARSLGQKPVKSKGRATLNGVDHGPKYRVTWRPTRNPFSLARKAARVRVAGAQSLRNHHRMIVSAKRIPPTRMRCLTVDSPHHMFLVGEAMIPTHNTHVGSNVLAEMALAEPGDYAVIAPTLGDAKKICVEGPSGLLKALGDDLRDYNKSDYILYLHNGSRIVLGSADAPDRIRGWNLRAVWCDEVGSWRDPKVWNEGVKFATRIGDPRIIITTTPTRGNKILVKLFDDYLGKGGDILGGFAGNTVLTRGGTYENRANLSEEWLREIEEEYAGTALGRQELEGELLRIVPGALVSMDTISLTRITVEQCPDFWNVVTALDPSVSNTEDSDECGIISAGVGPAPLDWIPPKGVPPSLADAPHIYIVEDSSLRAGPESWARQGLYTAAEWMADGMVAEVNNGGDLVFTNVLQVARSEGHKVPDLRPVHASVGKRTRAAPMGGMWNQHRVHLVGAGFKTLGDQWCTFVDGHGQKSPDRFDASVWAGTGLIPSLGVKSGTEVRVLGAA